MKKFLFLIALFTLMGGANSYATKKYASFSVANECTWNSGTNTMGFTAVNGWQILLTALPSGNISSYTTIHATLSDMSDNIDNIRLRIKDSEDHYADYNLVSGENNVNLANLAEANPSCNFESIKDITIWSPTSAAAGKTVDGENAASVVITDCYMEKPFVFAFDATGTAVVDVTDLQSWGCLSLNPQTGVVTNSYATPDNDNGYLKIHFPSAVDMSSVYGFKVNYTGDDILDGISFNNWRYKYGSNIYGRKDIAASMAEETSIEDWIWGARNTTGSLTITSVEFYSSVMSANPGEEAPMSGLTNYHKNGDIWETTGYTPNYRVNESTGAAYFGVDWSGENCQNYSDVEGYKAIRIYSEGDNTPRAMFFKSDASGQQAFNFTWNAKGYYELLLSNVYASVSNYKLISVRPASGTTSSISGIYMIVNNPIYDYVISGKGVMTSSVTAALADANATSYDATGVTATDVDLTSVANPNALFKANSGALSNTNNVIIDGTCANLVLTDGANNFKAPAGFTATSVSYDRTFTVDQASTVCFPFALTQDECDAAGVFYELTDFDGTTLTFTEVTSGGTTAYKPYLFKAASTNPFTSYSSKAVGATPADLSVSVNEGAAVMTGTMARQSVNGKYGWNSVGGAFSIATSDAVTIDPFRAYITISGGGLARVAARFVGDSVTGIDEVSETQNVLNPDRKYIENNNIVIVKNGVKYNAAGQLLK